MASRSFWQLVDRMAKYGWKYDDYGEPGEYIYFFHHEKEKLGTFFFRQSEIKMFLTHPPKEEIERRKRYAT